MEIQYNGATITVGKGTVRSKLQSNIIHARMGLNEHTSTLEWHMGTVYSRFLTRCTVVGELGFNLPAPDAEADALQAGYATFLDADEDFYDAVLAAMMHMDASVNALELAPEADPEA